jgi:hypothetical protein
MKALIGVDPHKATLAVAVVDEVVDEVVGELLECVSFLHNRAGFRARSSVGRNGSLSGVGRWRML